MKIINDFKRFFQNEDTKRILRYIVNGLKLSVYVLAIVIIMGIALWLTGDLEKITIENDLSQSSPGFWILIVVLVGFMFAAVGYGLFFSLHRYVRPGGKGILNHRYPNGNSYKALGHLLDGERGGK